MKRGLGALLWLVFLFGLLAGPKALAQSSDTLRGVVMEEDSKGELKPLADAHVYWMGTDFGTITGALGTFTLAATPQTRRLVLRYLGLPPDTLYIQDYKPVRVIMKPY
nr:carboxypeptidase-like regulatory domain-containing protein [Sphingomonadales bacterium]